MANAYIYNAYLKKTLSEAAKHFGLSMGNFSKKYLLLCLVCFVRQADAQSLLKKIFTRASYDTGYVDSYYDDYMHLTLVSLKQTHQVTVANTDKSLTYIYRPNSVFRFGMGVDYRFLSLEYSSQIDALNKSDLRKGFSELNSFRLGITGRRLLVNLLLQDIKGMYLENVADFSASWSSLTDFYPRRKDMHSVAYVGSMYYFFNHSRYSTMASLWQIDRQKKPAGSFLAGVTMSYHSLSGDTAVGPQATLANDSSAIIKDKVYQYGLNVGYAYNLVLYKRFFFNAIMVPGVNIQLGEESYTNGKKENQKPSTGLHGDFRFTAGYNGTRYYSGIMYTNNFLFSKIRSNVNIDFYHEYVRFFAGARFNIRKRK
ncbi:MAG: DUF4421 family protein [Bacteroidota bacterium]